jgi:hypothetical protein
MIVKAVNLEITTHCNRRCENCCSGIGRRPARHHNPEKDLTSIPDTVYDTDMDIREFNPNHEPAGSPEGGEFAGGGRGKAGEASRLAQKYSRLSSDTAKAVKARGSGWTAEEIAAQKSAAQDLEAHARKMGMSRTYTTRRGGPVSPADQHYSNPKNGDRIEVTSSSSYGPAKAEFKRGS